MKTCLIVPTCRNLNPFLEWWKNHREVWNSVIVVEDREDSEVNKEGTTSYSWKTVRKDLGEDYWIISKKDSAIRSYGVLKAYQKGYELFHFLDDDCAPYENPNVHFSVLTEGVNRWISSVFGERVRGLPYFNQGKIVPYINLGVWAGVPDFDAPNQLVRGNPELRLPKTTSIVPQNQYMPLCGMNISFRREVAVLFYYGLMGIESPYRRFDDIWSGIVAKKVCDHLSIPISYGPPAVFHSKASDPIVNLEKEAPGIRENEILWQRVDDVRLKGTTPKECFQEVWENLDVSGFPYQDYWSKAKRAALIWSEMF